MADWYVSSNSWNAIPQFIASHAYNLGDIVRPLTTPGFNAQYSFRCTVAGTSGAEPTWPANDGATVTTGGATFMNITGWGAYGWSAAAGNLWCMTSLGAGAATRFSPGDRVFVASDHLESYSGANPYVLNNAYQFGSIRVICVNRAGAVPPGAADIRTGAVIGWAGSGGLYIDPYMNQFWQGITFLFTGSTATSVIFSQSGVKTNYFKNCLFQINATSTAFVLTCGNRPAKVIFDNTTVSFNNATQTFGGNNYPLDVIWLNTPSAVGGVAPNTLIGPGGGDGQSLTCRGVDLSAVTNTLVTGGTNNGTVKALFESCRIAPGVVRFNGGASTQHVDDEVELVNCYDGTHFISERHTNAGDVTTEFSTFMNGGAQDNVGLYSHKMVSNTNADKYAFPLEGFWMDVNYTTVGASHTATVEIISSTTLNNDEVFLVLEYQGTSGSSVTSFVYSTPATIVTANSPIPTSSAVWSNPPATPVTQHLQVTFTPQTAGRIRAQVRVGLPSTTVWYNPQVTIT